MTNKHEKEKRLISLMLKNAHENNAKLFFIYKIGKHFIHDNTQYWHKQGYDVCNFFLMCVIFMRHQAIYIKVLKCINTI